MTVSTKRRLNSYLTVQLVQDESSRVYVGVPLCLQRIRRRVSDADVNDREDSW